MPLLFAPPLIQRPRSPRLAPATWKVVAEWFDCDDCCNWSVDGFVVCGYLVKLSSKSREPDEEVVQAWL